MRPPARRTLLWTIAALAALGLVVGGALANVSVLSQGQDDGAGSLSPVVEQAAPDAAAAKAEAAATARAAARVASLKAQRTAALASRRAAVVRASRVPTPSDVPAGPAATTTPPSAPADRRGDGSIDDNSGSGGSGGDRPDVDVGDSSGPGSGDDD